VIKANYRKKGLIGIAIAAALIVGTFGVHNIQAAGRVDTTRTVKITAVVEDGSIFASHFDKKLEIELYKIAKLDELGNASLTADFDDGTIDLSALKRTEDYKPDVATIKEKIVKPAIELAISKEPVDKIELDRSDEQSQNKDKASVELQEGAGIYLFIPKTVSDDKYTYDFTPYIIYAPTSDYLVYGEGSDEWNYESVFTLKSEASQLYGNLRIKKNLDKFNQNLQSQSFVYTVKAELDGKTVLNSVYKIDFNGAGNGERLIEKIPAQASVTVTESYSGSSYVSADGNTVQTTTIVAGQEKEVEFKNTYNGKNIIGGIAAENRFVVEDGVTYWIDENGGKVAQTSATSTETQPAEVPPEELPQ